MAKMKCEHKDCTKAAEYIVTTTSGNKRYLCEKHGKDLLKTLAAMRMSKL